VTAVKQARVEDIEPIDGMDLRPATTTSSPRCSTRAGTGGICVASHVVGREMSPHDRRARPAHEIHASLEDIFDVMFITSSPTPVKAALNMLGIRAGTAAAADGRGVGRGGAGDPWRARAPRAA